eukprot:TRINITY_DN4668_c0_g1_i3.p1 TRINITY_DN4668_c0_g1~~TRINITY_DN4668_c0_g1_i3.p1  ORF type:complete len:481 (+),score=64.39 TRINITY_DN4668_c0_g1_i3:271-1713(+)
MDLVLELDRDTFTCGDISAGPSEVTVTLTVRDAADNAGSATATVTVVDLQPPTAVPVTTTDVYLDSSSPPVATLVAGDLDDASADECPLTFSLSRDTFECGDLEGNPHMVSFTATDSYGNAHSQNVLVNVFDSWDPLITVLPLENTITLSSFGGVWFISDYTYLHVAIDDNCPEADLTTTVSPDWFSCADLGDVDVIVTATDLAGNSNSATVTVTVVDEDPPRIVTRDIEVDVGSGMVTITALQVNDNSYDNCDEYSPTLSVAPFSFAQCTDIGVPTTVTLTATDSSNNEATGTAMVTPMDGTPPAVITRDITVVLSGGTYSLAAGEVDNGSSDLCGDVTLSVLPNAFTCDDVGTVVVTLTVEDEYGNSATGTAMVTVESPSMPCVIETPVLRLYMYHKAELSWDVSGATSIDLEFVDMDVLPLAPVVIATNLPPAGSVTFVPHHLPPTPNARVNVVDADSGAVLAEIVVELYAVWSPFR